MLQEMASKKECSGWVGLASLKGEDVALPKAMSHLGAQEVPVSLPGSNFRAKL